MATESTKDLISARNKADVEANALIAELDVATDQETKKEIGSQLSIVEKLRDRLETRIGLRDLDSPDVPAHQQLGYQRERFAGEKKRMAEDELAVIDPTLPEGPYVPVKRPFTGPADQGVQYKPGTGEGFVATPAARAEAPAAARDGVTYEEALRRVSSHSGYGFKGVSPREGANWFGLEDAAKKLRAASNAGTIQLDSRLAVDIDLLLKFVEAREQQEAALASR